MRNLIKISLVLLANTLVHAHVGSPDVYYEGDAGPYHLFVTVRLPQAIPGVAEIQVRSASPDVQSIQVSLLHLTGPGIPPVPNVAERSKDDPQFFVGNLWFLEFGSLQVRMEVEGSKGKAELSVPVASFARQSMPMDRGLRWVLAFFFVFLTLSAVPIAGGIVKESTVPPGQVPQIPNQRRARIVMVAVLILAVTVLYVNRTWCNGEAATHERNIDLLKPPPAEITLDGSRLLIRPAGPLIVPDPSLGDREVKIDELIPDHGHLMHLFLVASPGMERMWHLHPDRAAGDAFAAKLPTIPAGNYQVFADILDKTGFPWTLVGRVRMPQLNGSATAGDDSAWAGAPFTTAFSDATAVQLPDGAHVVWERGDQPVKANVPATLKFRVEGKDGLPARDLEPYMGMAAHAQVVSSDMSVFAHIHPAGSVPMAALDLAQRSLAAESSGNASEMTMPMPSPSRSLSPDLSFAYGFPHAGHYRIFLQVKRSGQVQTAVFDAHVQ